MQAYITILHNLVELYTRKHGVIRFSLNFQGLQAPYGWQYAGLNKRHEEHVQHAVWQPAAGDVQPVRELLLRPPDRRPLQGQYPYPYNRERIQGPGQIQPHAIPPQMMGGPVQSSSSEGPQQSMWATRNDMPYPCRTGKARAAPTQAHFTA